MEALVALSLAANIAQFVDLSSKIIYGAKEIHESGTNSTEENVQLENITQSMRLISLKLDPPSSGQQSADEQALRRLASDCRVLSQRLSDLLQGVTVKDATRKREAIASALKNVWTRRDRVELERRLDSCRAQLELQLQFMTSTDMKNRLISIGMSTDRQVEMLKLIHKHVADLAQGSRVTSISADAQNQIRELLQLSQTQYDNLARTHIVKGLKTPDTNLRFDNVEVAHPETFRWLFAQQNPIGKDSRATAGLDAKDRKEEMSANMGHDLHDQDSRSTIVREWSVWQLDDGYEEENKDWWYERDDPDIWNPCHSEILVTGPEHKYLLEAGQTLIEWLSSGSGIFHISGKLGSGKSTLMKFLWNHSRPEIELQKWTDKKTLVLANFFFWKPGSKEQKSLSGLFRSLLHEILQSCPDLVASIFPARWRDLMTCPWHVRPDVQFTDREIRTAITALFHRKITYDKYAFCLFIDGLDEYEETLQADYKVLIDTLKEWVELSSGSLKICVSSREHNVFENAFSAEKRIRLQDLTRLDMERYASEMLEDMKDEAQKSRLVSEIVNKSDGIFLWVALVVKMFREWIEDDQDIESFDAILESLPEELELLFDHLLKTVRKPARKRAYQVFALMAEIKDVYKEQLFLLSSIFLEDYERDQQFAMDPIFKYPQNRIPALEVVAQKRLNGFCRGLVQVKETADKGRYIAFTHRSVPEFLEKENVQKEMKIQLTGFDLTIVVPHLFLAYLRSMEKATNHSFWANFAAKLITDDFDPYAPFPYLTCLESVIIDKIGRAGTLAMDGAQPLDQQTIVVTGGWRYYFDNGRSIGNFFLVSPFYLSAWFQKLDYVRWRIGLDPALLNEVHKKTFLARCLHLDLNSSNDMEKFRALQLE